ncbi:hypothetical protein JOF28_001267 [Leucobacter exalbidus]|uniref:Uncharacterized protein n=1 Tax=Leucobacter exalbidus TaxID=662960 RepID=A0A940PMY0_9MICO|nr:hypothetical protein [Leucobacter exalbidus]
MVSQVTPPAIARANPLLSGMVPKPITRNLICDGVLA